MAASTAAARTLSWRQGEDSGILLKLSFHYSRKVFNYVEFAKKKEEKMNE